MENVYPPENFLATEPLELTSYFKEFQAECHLQPIDLKDEYEERLKLLKADFNIDLEVGDIKTLEELCTIDKLKLTNENTKLPMKTVQNNHYIPIVHPFVAEGKSLETVKCKEMFNLTTKEVHVDLKTNAAWHYDDDTNLIKDIKPGSTFIHKVVIYMPFNSIHSMLGNRRLSLESFRQQYELEVVGTTTLLELANAIKCASDCIVIKEVENAEADLSSLLTAREQYPSRCFFIENVFYNDMSHPNATDYSTVIKKWALESNIGDFTSESMENVTMNDLKPRLGYGYVYIHQGNCEHIITFSDARLIQKCDCLVSQKYPRVISQKHHTNYMCLICTETHASWMVANSDRLPIRKAFFCTKCLNSYMYLDGQKIGNFQLFPFYNEAFATGF